MIQAFDAAGPSRPRITLTALAARAVEIGLVALLAWIAAQALWFAVHGTDALDLTVEAPLGAADPVQAGLDRPGSATGLFDALDGAAPVAEAAPETRLNMTLRGVRSGANGSAVIETPNQGQRSIPVGGEIAPGVTLVAVEDERVIINRSGARESLFLTEAAARRAREQRDRPQLAPAPAVRSADAANVLSGQPDLELARQLTRRDWINGLRLEPALEGGRLTGMRVRDSSASDVLRASGLLPGDVITRLNGEPLTSAEAAARALRGLESADRVAVAVRRGEEEITLSAPLP
jgi:general secretion pathway protein C